MIHFYKNKDKYTFLTFLLLPDRHNFTPIKDCISLNFFGLLVKSGIVRQNPSLGIMDFKGLLGLRARTLGFSLKNHRSYLARCLPGESSARRPTRRIFKSSRTKQININVNYGLISKPIILSGPRPGHNSSGERTSSLTTVRI